MKVHEVIKLLQNFPMEMEVECIHESSTWIWNGEYSTEVTVCKDGPVETVESWTNEDGETVVRIS